MVHNCNAFLKNILRADIRLSSTVDNCWSAELLSAFDGLVGKMNFEQAVKDMHHVDLKDLVPDLRERHVRVWRGVARLDPCATSDKLASYEHWMALPLHSRSMSSAMLSVPKYLFLNLSRHVQRNVSCFRLRAHRLAVETASWSNDGQSVCSCGCVERQDEKHVLLSCRFPHVCALRENYSDLFGGFSSLSPGTGASYAESSRAVPDYYIFQFMNQCNNRIYSFISDLLDFYSLPSSHC